jgi:hypothetical protein
MHSKAHNLWLHLSLNISSKMQLPLRETSMSKQDIIMNLLDSPLII